MADEHTQDGLAQAARRAVQVVPTPAQMAWQELEFIAFAHFGPNTFTDREWGDGTENPAVFSPTAFDAHQWVRVCRDAGIKMLILTAKHHDGFCLWPSAYTAHSVKHSPWRGGQGDVVREVAEACREGGLKLGLYLSPWDRHEPTYGDSPAYNAHFCAQLRELLTGYGEIGEVWFDGACGEGPNGKRQIYDWASYYSLVRALQPRAAIAICGPDVRWCGNEKGFAAETNWSVQGFEADPLTRPPDWVQRHDLEHRYVSGQEAPVLGSLKQLALCAWLGWHPAECDTSIRPGWFYHASEDDKVKSLDTLVDTYEKSVGRNGLLLLNLPPDRRGLIHEHDAQRLRALRQALDATFQHNLALGKPVTTRALRGNDPAYAAAHIVDGDPTTYWTADEGVTSAWLEIDLGEPLTFNRAVLQEHIAIGQRVAAYVLEAWAGNAWVPFARGTTIGYKKLERFADLTTNRVRLHIAKARACPAIRSLGLYRAP